MTSANSEPPTETAALLLTNVTSGYGDTTVLENVSLRVDRGAVIALLGANGAGKTTALRTASGIVPARHGVIELLGKDVTGLSPAARAKAGLCVVPEGRGIFPSLTVRENLLVAVAHRKDRSAALDRVTATFPQLRDRLSQVAGTLSGGQQQMVGLARCFVVSPKVVLLDEVSIGLAPKVIDEIYEIIRKLAAAGTSMVLVEQYVDRALEVADVVHVLHRGSITLSSAPSEVSREELLEELSTRRPRATGLKESRSPRRLSTRRNICEEAQRSRETGRLHDRQIADNAII